MIRTLKTTLFIKIFFYFTCTSAFAFDHSHSNWDKVLNKFVKWSEYTSTVNYKELKKDRKNLNDYLKELSAVKDSDFLTWTQEQQLAFLINAYNAWTVELILENYPIKSIKDIGGIFSNPWKKKFFTLFGAKTSLDWIEHEKIRRHYNEPRIHFAVVCASIGCPGLSPKAFIAERLNDQLDTATKNFLNDISRNKYDLKTKTIYLSSIFKWYKEDFVKSKGSIQAFIYPYLDSLKSEDFNSVTKLPIKYLDYDWSLNETKM